MKHNREGVLLNGMYFLWRNGYFATGINDILASCGLPKGSFYNMFESKEDFCIETLSLYCNIMHTDMQEFLTDKKFNPIERLKNFYLHQIEQMFDGDAVRGCYLGNLSLEIGSANKKFKKEFTAHFDTNKNLLEKCLNEAEHKGLLNEIFLPFDAADMLQSSWYGAVLKTKATGKVAALNDFLINAFEPLKP